MVLSPTRHSCESAIGLSALHTSHVSTLQGISGIQHPINELGGDCGFESNMCLICCESVVIVGDIIVLIVVAMVLVETSEVPVESIHPAQRFGQSEDE